MRRKRWKKKINAGYAEKECGRLPKKIWFFPPQVVGWCNWLLASVGLSEGGEGWEGGIPRGDDAEGGTGKVGSESKTPNEKTAGGAPAGAAGEQVKSGLGYREGYAMTKSSQLSARCMVSAALCGIQGFFKEREHKEDGSTLASSKQVVLLLGL